MNNPIMRRLRGAAAALAAAACFLTACTANTAVLDEHGLRPHLTVDMQLPDKPAADRAQRFTIAVQERGEPVRGGQVTFEFWPEGQPAQRTAVPGRDEGNGVYSAEHSLPGEGLYVVRCLVEAGGQTVMPAKRLAIGRDAVLRLAELERTERGGAQASGSGGGGHDGHH